MKKSNQILQGILMSAIVLFSPSLVKSQQFLTQITPWNWNAYIHLPSDYNNNPTKNYPTIIFFPGIGEVGTDASLVITNGPGAYLAQGWDGNVSIGTTDSVEFIIASVQPVLAWSSNFQTDSVVKDIKALYRVDPNRLYLTGLSLGGWQCSQYVTGDTLGGPYDYAGQIAAEVNVEGVAINVDTPLLSLWDNFAYAGGRLACFEQLNDYRQMQTYVSQMDSAIPNSAIYTQTDFGDGSHCCWSSFYGGEGVLPTNFLLDGVSQNIYQWMARQSLAPGHNQTILPVRLINFSVEKNNEMAVLQWGTASETNAKEFEIEKSMDGIDFSSIATVTAKGNTTTITNYSFSDVINNIIAPTIYYRLKIVNTDGSFIYSSVVELKNTTTAAINIYPQPVKNNFILSTQQNGLYTISLFSIEGKKINEWNNVAIEQQKNFTISRNNIAPGTYLLKVVNTQTNATTNLKTIFQ